MHKYLHSLSFVTFAHSLSCPVHASLTPFHPSVGVFASTRPRLQRSIKTTTTTSIEPPHSTFRFRFCPQLLTRALQTGEAGAVQPGNAPKTGSVEKGISPQTLPQKGNVSQFPAVPKGATPQSPAVQKGDAPQAVDALPQPETLQNKNPIDLLHRALEVVCLCA